MYYREYLKHKDNIKEFIAKQITEKKNNNFKEKNKSASKKVAQIKDGRLVNIWDCCRQVVEENNTYSLPVLYSKARGKNNDHLYKGYQWYYVEDFGEFISNKILNEKKENKNYEQCTD